MKNEKAPIHHLKKRAQITKRSLRRTEKGPKNDYSPTAARQNRVQVTGRYSRVFFVFWAISAAFVEHHRYECYRCAGSGVHARGRQDADGGHDAFGEPGHNPPTWQSSVHLVRRGGEY